MKRTNSTIHRAGRRGLNAVLLTAALLATSLSGIAPGTAATRSSAAAGVTRHYTYAGRLNRDAIDARVWSGIHFRKADVVGNNMGKKVGDFALDHYFQPLAD